MRRIYGSHYWTLIPAKLFLSIKFTFVHKMKVGFYRVLSEINSSRVRGIYKNCHQVKMHPKKCHIINSNKISAKFSSELFFTTSAFVRGAINTNLTILVLNFFHNIWHCNVSWSCPIRFAQPTFHFITQLAIHDLQYLADACPKVVIRY